LGLVFERHVAGVADAVECVFRVPSESAEQSVEIVLRRSLGPFANWIGRLPLSLN
jgi:hypothetical protein